MNQQQRHTDRETVYRIRIMVCVIIAEFVALGFFSLWPHPAGLQTPYRDIDFSEDAIAIEDVVRTKQQNSPPPPPKPQVPVPVPNDEVIEEEIITLDDLNISKYSDSLSTTMMGSEGDADEPVSSPQISPSIIHIVEPTVPEAVKSENIKAEIYVTFLVDKQGSVEEANISEIKLYNPKTGKVKNVESIGYGLTEATIKAALQWKFRPARNKGQPVMAYTRQVFSFGF